MSETGATTTKRGWSSLFVDAGKEWVEHNAAQMGAALAYYSIFSIGPLLVIAISVAGLVFGEQAARASVSGQLESMLGESGAQAVSALLQGAQGQQTAGIIAAAVSGATLIAAAVGVVVQLKDSLNTIWEVPAAETSGAWAFVRSYLISFAAILGLGFLLLTSLLLSAFMSALAGAVAPMLPDAIFRAADFAVSFLVITLLFAAMFRMLPEAEIAWGDVFVGAAVTALLFNIGKLLIGLYVGSQGLDSTYGAAASIVVVLIWVYYSAQIVLYGACFTRVYALRYGSQKAQAGAVQAARAEVKAAVARKDEVNRDGRPAAPAGRAAPAGAFAAAPLVAVLAALAAATVWRGPGRAEG